MESKNKDSNINDVENFDITKYPITTNTFSWTPTAVFLFILLHVLSFLMPSVMILTFYSNALNSNLFNWRMLLIMVDVFAWWGAYLLISLLLGKLFLIVLKLIHAPKEGLFKIDKKNKDYSFYCLRIVIKKFIFWTYNNFCFPWASNLAFKMCDMKADFKSTMFDGWSDVEFIDFGNNMMLGQGAIVFSSTIIRIDKIDYLLIKKVIIGDHVVLGGNAIVAPGTIIGKGTTLGVWGATHIGQVLEPDWIYIGRPARKYVSAQKMIEASKKQAIRRIVDTGEKIPFDINQHANKKN